MYIMDDVLDLLDAVEGTLSRGKRILRRLTKGESGAAPLMAVLIMLVAGATILVPLMGFIYSGTTQSRMHQSKTHTYYAADSGIEDGMWRVSNEDLPSWMQVSPWSTSIFTHNPAYYEYTLPTTVNDRIVTVQIQPIWVLAGLETMPSGQTPHAGWVTFSNEVTPGHYQIVINFDRSKNLKLDRIGVWLPEGFDYVPGSSSLEGGYGSGIIPGAPAYMVPTVSAYRGGSVVVWDWPKNNPVAYDDLPGDSPTSKAIEFTYTPATLMSGAWSWSRALSNDIAVSWSGDMKLYQVTSTAQDPATGSETSVVAYNLINESTGTGSALYGDYAATGQALMRDSVVTGDNGIRDRLYFNSKAALTGVPDSGTARKIVLYWSGWKSFPVNAFYGASDNLSAWTDAQRASLQALASNYKVNQVSLTVTTPAGVTFVDPNPVVATTWTVLPNGNMGSPNGWSYSCEADITSLVTEYFAGVGAAFIGNATYTVGHAASAAGSPTDRTLQGIWGSSDNNVYVVGDSGTIVRYDGGSWSTQTSGTTSGLKGVWGSSSTDIFAVGDTHTTSKKNYYTILHYNGSAWSYQTTPQSSNSLYGVWGWNSSNVFAVGANGAILKYNGSTWTAQTSGSSATLRGVWGSSATNVWVVGDRYKSGSTYYYTLLHTTNGGTSWTAVSKTGGQDLKGIWGTDANNMFAVGANGTILRSTDGGTSWAAMGVPTGFTTTLYGVWGSSATDVYAVGAGGAILHWDGNTSHAWAAVTSGSVRNLYGAWGSVSTNVYAVGESTGTAGTLLHWDGTSWSSVTGGYDLYGWVANHSGETVVAHTDYRLGDNSGSEWAYAAWSVVVIYTSPETTGHQLYMYDTFRYWDNYGDDYITISDFLAPANVATDPNAVRLTCFVAEGDACYTGDNIYLGDSLPVSLLTKLNTGGTGTALENNNVWNSKSNTGESADGVDIDTFSVTYPVIKPGDSTAYVRLQTGVDSWNLVYMILSFRSDVTGTGLLTYIVK